MDHSVAQGASREAFLQFQKGFDRRISYPLLFARVTPWRPRRRRSLQPQLIGASETIAAVFVYAGRRPLSRFRISRRAAPARLGTDAPGVQFAACGRAN